MALIKNYFNVNTGLSVKNAYIRIAKIEMTPDNGDVDSGLIRITTFNYVSKSERIAEKEPFLVESFSIKHDQRSKYFSMVQLIVKDPWELCYLYLKDTKDFKGAKDD